MTLDRFNSSALSSLALCRVAASALSLTSTAHTRSHGEHDLGARIHTITRDNVACRNELPLNAIERGERVSWGEVGSGEK